MFKYLFNIIGKLTLPENAEQCELDDWWIYCSYEELPAYVWGDNIHDYHYIYNYQSIKQNWYGKWEKELKYLGRNHPLSYYRELLNNNIKVFD